MRLGAFVHMYPPLHNAGAEHMLHAILLHAVKAGHECNVVLGQGRGYQRINFFPYTVDGVSVSEDMADLSGVDVLITHLDRTPEAEMWCRTHRVPCVQLFHNDARPRMARWCQFGVFNSDWIAAKGGRYVKRSLVLHPPIWPERYRVAPGDRATLINLQAPKGVQLFYALAEAMPDVGFLGVFGAYGVQVMPPQLDNLVLLPQQRDIRRAYEQTRVLLMPSSYESYGRCAIEAAFSGIPTVAHPTPGLKEALAHAGVFPAALTVDAWEPAIRQVLAEWGQHSERALDLAAQLQPAADIDRLLTALAEL
jgi:hypothetical protein